MLKNFVIAIILSTAYLSIQSAETAPLVRGQASIPYGACAIAPSIRTNFHPEQSRFSTQDPLKIALDHAKERFAQTHPSNAFSHCYTGWVLRNASIHAARHSQISNELEWARHEHNNHACECCSRTTTCCAITCLTTIRECSEKTIASVEEQVKARKRLLPTNAHNIYDAYEFYIQPADYSNNEI